MERERTTKKILLIDDSQTVLTMERMTLAPEGFQIVTATNGAEACERARLEKPDLVLMDVVMPVMNGLDACNALRADPTTRNIPIILVVPRGEGENPERSYRSGCNDYLTKPIHGAELLSKVRRILGSAP